MVAGFFTAVVPVKPIAVAKTRLCGDPALRSRLALAFALDTVSAVAACTGIARVVVVTDDAVVSDALAPQPGVLVVPDEPDAGLNAALRHGVGVGRGMAPGDGVLIVSSDLPALRPDELAAALDDVPADGAAFVCDTAGVGTTALAMPPGVTVEPRFGPRSHAAHQQVAARIDRLDIRSVRRDVDTWVDLWDARRMGVGMRTVAALS
jgi:2-phospho-L-lactate guanylyltransferase